MWAKLWTWIKKYWKWVLFPIGILIVLGSLFARRRQTTVVVSDGHATDLAIKEHDAQVAAAAAAAEAKAQAELKAIEEKHAAVIAEFKDSQRLQYEVLKAQGPQAVTNWLLSLGKPKPRAKGKRR